MSTYFESGKYEKYECVNYAALEYADGQWRIYNYLEDKERNQQPIYDEPEKYLDNSELFKNLLQEFSFPKS